ncbi:hypothetical protein [Lysobacter gummosus]|uniref:hypothetical protein n=1 Tax=Lysobacter gummosus TaxID=262324 RepID=UPI00363CF7DA
MGSHGLLRTCRLHPHMRCHGGSRHCQGSFIVGCVVMRVGCAPSNSFKPKPLRGSA